MVKALNKAPQNKPTPTNTTRVAIIDANGTFPKFSVKAERKQYRFGLKKNQPKIDIPQFFIFFIEQLFLIFKQILSIRAFGRRDLEFLIFKGGCRGSSESIDTSKRIRMNTDIIFLVCQTLIL